MKPLLLALLVLFALPQVTAFIDVQAISTDPATIAAGDEVDITIDYTIPDLENRAANPDWKLEVKLQADDTRSEQYIEIVDAAGNNDYKIVGAQIDQRTQYRIKVSPQAPTGTYELALVGQWYRNDEPSGAQSISRFTIEVKRNAILLTTADLNSNPERLVPGTREAELTLNFANSGEKDAKEVIVDATLPANIKPSYASGSRMFVGTIAAQSNAQTTLYVDLDKELPSGTYDLPLTVTYLDEEQNSYVRELTARLFIASKPRIEVSQANIVAKQGEEFAAEFTITNKGDVAAEAIDVRLLKESSQPFQLDTRSVYVSKLQPQESATVKVPLRVEKTALAQEYQIPVFIRAKGDSDESDNTIYSFREDIVVSVEEKQSYLAIGIAIAFLAIIGLVILLRRYK